MGFFGGSMNTLGVFSETPTRGELAGLPASDLEKKGNLTRWPKSKRAAELDTGA